MWLDENGKCPLLVASDLDGDMCAGSSTYALTSVSCGQCQYPTVPACENTPYIFLNVIKPLWMSLLHVFPPEMMGFKKFCTLWRFATEFRFILLLDKL